MTQAGSPTPIATWARRYIEKFGLALVSIDPGEKAPKGNGWNKPGGYFTDADQAEAFLAIECRRVETLAVVDHAQADRTSVAAQFHGSVAGAAMFDDVLQRLLGDAIQAQGGVVGERVRDLVMLDGNRHAVTAR